MFERIMVPLDGSTFGEFALPVGVDVARRADGRIDLVNVNDPLPAVPEELSREASLAEASGRYLEEVSKRVRDVWDGPVDFRVMRGPVVGSLAEVAGELPADLVVMATHGRGPFSRFWLGSVADGLVRQATVPVLLMRPRKGETPDLASPPGFGTILLPLDRSEVSMDVVEEAVALGALYDARYHLVTVVHHPSEYVDPYLPETATLDAGWIEQAMEESRRRLLAQAERMEKRGLEAEVTVIEASSPGAGILEVADEVEADMIAMGTHGRGGVPRMVLGSVADKVARGSDRPVLLYRPPTG